MRRVHEILRNSGQAGNGQPVIIAFIQHGTRETGFVYENICPWCATTVEKVTANPDAENTVVFNRLRLGIAEHIWLCPERGSDRLQVERTTVPLDTERLIKEV